MQFIVKDIVKDNAVCFLKYRKGIAYYGVKVPPENHEYMFPIPLSDIGDATLLATDKAMVFMRYIRKAIEDNTFVKAA